MKSRGQTRGLPGGLRAALCALLLAQVGVAGCGDDDRQATGRDAGPPDGSDEPDCYENPTTHLEIINACTDAEKVSKNPVLPLRNPDGTLPPLP